ncbi:dGTPase [Actinoplanes couchii]|nr:dGTPase [Actinoplanes couchii]
MEAEIMDWADDITYAVHDLEDFARLGVIPIADLLSEGETLIRFSAWLTKKWESKGNANAIEALDEALGCMKKHLPVRSFKRSSERDVALSLFTARMVHECIKGTSLEFRDSVHPWAMRRPDRLNLAVEAMKELAWYFVIDGAEVRPSQVGQRIMIRTVFEYFYGEARRIASGLSHAHLPRSTRISAEITRNSGLDISPARIACDAICDLNEMQTSRLYNRLTGATIGQSDIFGESQEAASYPAIWGANPGR